jgi:Helicase HerA, central domain
MKLGYRLSVMVLSLAIIVVIGWWATNSFNFLVNQFWFVAGALLLILLSLVDQPHFSKDANVFANGAAAWVSLFAVPENQRSSIWWIFLFWAIYLVTVSFILMAMRSNPLLLETRRIQFFSRLNRIIGRPESIFSAFFIWGLFLQFAYPQNGRVLNAFLLFWAIFMILNVPSIAQTVESLFERSKPVEEIAGILIGVHSPRVAEVRLNENFPENLSGQRVHLQINGQTKVAEGTLFDDRIVRGVRKGRIALTAFDPAWRKISGATRVEMISAVGPELDSSPVGVVGVGSSIGKVMFDLDPRVTLHEGQVVRVQAAEVESYYQIVSATISERGVEEGNSVQSVKVAAGQLGCWNESRASFEPIDWVAPAGEPVFLSEGEMIESALPEGVIVVGQVPSSKFPVHVHISDSVTHNTALLGVTGSGKSYLAFHLIEAYLNTGIKVLILDLTRQHWQFLQGHAPTALTSPADVAAWLNGESRLAIHQFANAVSGFPKMTADFAEKCFEWLQGNTQLRAGVDVPGRLCIVLEEAHSLIPEWNQVAQQSDPQHVNRAARVMLQG